MSIRLVTFDLDHTLWDPHEALISAEKAMYQWLSDELPQFSTLFSYQDVVSYRIKMAKSRPTMAWQVSTFRKHVLRLLLLQLGVAEHQIPDLVEQAFMVFFKERSNLELFEGAQEVLKELSANHNLIALTNGNASLRLVGINHWFSAYFNAENVNAPKPDPAMFLAALEHAKVEASQTVHVGDHPEMDVLAAKALGIKAVWVNYHQHEWQHDIQPDAIISDIRQLPEAINSLS